MCSMQPNLQNNAYLYRNFIKYILGRWQVPQRPAHIRRDLFPSPIKVDTPPFWRRPFILRVILSALRVGNRMLLLFESVCVCDCDCVCVCDWDIALWWRRWRLSQVYDHGPGKRRGKHEAHGDDRPASSLGQASQADQTDCLAL